MEPLLPIGKLPPALLTRILAQPAASDPRVLIGPSPGFDCAVVENGDSLLVFKSDPITFASDEIGWYVVQINSNDIVTTGATPRWFLVTLLLPEGKTTAALVEAIMQQVYATCRELNVTVIGGHSEVTAGLDRPILAGTMIGEVAPERLVTPRGATPGDRILLTKGVPIEATAVLAREFAVQLQPLLTPEALRQAQAFLYRPGISVLRDAQIALAAGRVTAMHDPTEGGLATALWELADASGRELNVDLAAVPIPPLAARVCAAFDLDPLAAIASGALLLTVAGDDTEEIRHALQKEGVTCAEIGVVAGGPAAVRYKTGAGWERLPRPLRDEIARVYEA